MAEKIKRRKFCYTPWVRLDTYAEGKANVCCNAWVKLAPIDIGNQSMMEVWNSPQAKKLRSSILDGSFRYCREDTCPFLHDACTSEGGNHPQTVKYVDEVTNPYLKKIINENIIELPQGPSYWHAAHDRTCNLSCPSCRTDVIALKKEEAEKEIIFQNRFLDEVGSGLKIVNIAGDGDPFSSSVYKDLIDRIGRDFPQIEINLFTNGLLWNEGNWEKLGEARHSVKYANISVDAASKGTFETLRRGASWEKMLKNLEFVSKLRRENQLKHVRLYFVVQSKNYREMKEFVTFSKKFGFDEVHYIKLTNLGAFSEEEFKECDVSDSRHPQYLELLDVLADPVFDDPSVWLGTFRILREAAFKERRSFSSRIKRLFDRVNFI